MEQNLYLKLLTSYCDRLVTSQFPADRLVFSGGFMCPACKMIHGRSPDAVYPLAVMFKLTNEKKYLDAAEAVFDYGEELMCTDGALYNDAQAGWRFTTVFHTIAVTETILSLDGILPEKFSQKLLKRAEKMSRWLFENLDEHAAANINYAATNSLAMGLSGKVFGKEEYTLRAKHLADYALKHFSENGLFFGESLNHDALSPLGCRAVDIGYDMEESIPSLVKYAKLVGNEKMLEFLSEKLAQITEFMLPDGGLDNSFGCRNNKWTYWGSRTSDGVFPAYLLLADKNPMFAEASFRNLSLLAECSDDGYLYGGPHYEAHGEHPCLHHSFEHACALAFVVDNIEEKYLCGNGSSLPADKDFFRFYPEINTYKMTVGNFCATVTGYDFAVTFSGHASGGTLTMLYGKNVGPMIAASVTDYVLAEPTNMQQPLDIEHHRSLVPRLVLQNGKKLFSSSYFRHMSTESRQTENMVCVEAQTGLSTKDDEILQGVCPRFFYELTREGMKIKIFGAKGTTFVLPLIAGKVFAEKGTEQKVDDIFFLTGGFCAKEHTILPDDEGNIILFITEE